MRIHHLNCGSHCPLGGHFFDGSSHGLFADIVTHCLLIETEQGLVLVDTGYGLEDMRRPRSRLSRIWPTVLNIQYRESDTAACQVKDLGFSVRDVRHIVLTHLDFDHAGGLEDFPEARVHVMKRELEAAEHWRRGFVAFQRYRPPQWDDVREWRTYAAGGERWFGFDAVRSLDGLPPEILIVPMYGHTLGHAAIAIQTREGWLLNAGDAYLHANEMNDGRPRIPGGLAIYQYVMDADRHMRIANRDRLRELMREHGSAATIFCSHDTQAFLTMKQRSTYATASSIKQLRSAPPDKL